MLIDSNIIIYAAKPEHGELRRFIADNAPCVSAISLIEVLGYHQLTDEARLHFEEFFKAAPVLQVSEEVVQQAVKLRQAKKMTLGDALVAATALVHGHALGTKNIKDFTGIPGLTVFDPLEKPPA